MEPPMTLLAIALLSILPRDFCARESVELIETNHVFTYEGEPHLTQAIFYGREGIIAWRMNSEGKLNPTGNVLYFMDAGIVRCITARTVAKSWTQHDVELSAREYLPANERRELKQAKGR
jgi:hypothetical protein